MSTDRRAGRGVDDYAATVSIGTRHFHGRMQSGAVG
jgi:hypothetical protein